MSKITRERLSTHQVQHYYQCPNCTSPVHYKRKTCRRCGWGRALNSRIPERLRSVRHKILGAGYRVSRRVGRGFVPCPDCQESIPKKAKSCRFCGWEGGYRAKVRPTLRHFMLSRIHTNRLQSRATMPCPHCQWDMPAKARRCPLCLRAPEFRDPESMPFRRAWLHLRRRWVERAERKIVVCPSCSIQVPSWTTNCLSCGWERPRATGKIAMMRYAFAEIKGDVWDRLHPHSEGPSGELCPECDTLIPHTDKICMVCGWVPDRKKSIRDAAGFLLEEIKHRGAAGESARPPSLSGLPGSDAA